jgi:hypothetical protein
MKKIFLLMTLLTVTIAVNAQTGILIKRYDIGRDTTNKALAFPKVVLDSFHTGKRAMFVYDLKDSVLYHFDSNKRVRYMTYRDTVLIKQLIASSVPVVDTATIATKDYVNSNFIKNGGNAFGSAVSIGSNDNNSIAIKTNNVNRVTVAADGDINATGKISIQKASSEVQLDLASSPTGHLYAGVSTGTLDVSNRGFLSFGDAYGSSNSAVVFGNSKVSVANANLLVGTYTDNGTDKGQFNGTVQSHGVKFNNATSPNPINSYNLVRRFNDGAVDGIELITGGASGNFKGGFRIKSRGSNGATNPTESFYIAGDIITMGHHGIDAGNNSYFSGSVSQINIARDNTDGHLLNLWTRRAGYPAILTMSNLYYGAGGPSMNCSIVSEAAGGYNGILSFFTNTGGGGAYSNNVRAMFVDYNQNVGIGLSRALPPTQNATGIALPSAKLHVLGNITTTPISIFQAPASQTADLTQWRNSTGTVLASIDKDGNANIQKLKTAQPSANGAGEIKIGKVITTSTVTLQTDKFLEVEIDGTIYKLAIVQ